MHRFARNWRGAERRACRRPSSLRLEIVTADERKLTAKLRAMAIEPGPEARIAYDGMELILR
jgi:hypothetical protein